MESENKQENPIVETTQEQVVETIQEPVMDTPSSSTEQQVDGNDENTSSDVEKTTGETGDSQSEGEIEKPLSEIDKLKQENEQLRAEILNGKLSFMSNEQLEEFNALDIDLNTREKLAGFLNKHTKTPTQTNETATIVKNSYDEQFDVNGDVILKDLHDLL